MLALEWSSREPAFGVRLFGNILAPHNSCATDQGIMFGVQSNAKSSIMAPCKPEHRYQCLMHRGNSTVTGADAILLARPGLSTAFATSDCGAAIFAARDTSDTVLVHPGRNQLMDIAAPHERRTIVSAVIDTLVERGAKPEAIKAVLLGQISAEYFSHRGHEAEAAIKAQVALWGEAIMPDPERVTLDLAALLQAQLTFYGVVGKQLLQLRHDPYRSHDLASKRAGKLGSNVVVLQRLQLANAAS